MNVRKDIDYSELFDQWRFYDLDMMVRPAEYIEYTCSKCGKLVKVKSN